MWINKIVKIYEDKPSIEITFTITLISFWLGILVFCLIFFSSNFFTKQQQERSFLAESIFSQQAQSLLTTISFFSSRSNHRFECEKIHCSKNEETIRVLINKTLLIVFTLNFHLAKWFVIQTRKNAQCFFSLKKKKTNIDGLLNLFDVSSDTTTNHIVKRFKSYFHTSRMLCEMKFFVEKFRDTTDSSKTRQTDEFFALISYWDHQTIFGIEARLVCSWRSTKCDNENTVSIGTIHSKPWECVQFKYIF